MSPADRIAAQLAHHDSAVEQAIFGTPHASTIGAQLEQAVSTALGSVIDDCASVGAVAGLALQDGRRVVTPRRTPS